MSAVTRLVASLSGPADAQRAELLDSVPLVVAYFSEGSAALAADFYEDERERAQVRGRFSPEPVVADRMEKLGRAVVWASEPLFDPGIETTVTERLAPVIQLETARPYRDTVTTNQRRDPQAVGWRRVSGGGCPFCRMLAGRGAVYKSDTARFASHPHCHCTAAPVFAGQQSGPEASPLQYAASRRRKSEADRARVRAYLAGMDA